MKSNFADSVFTIGRSANDKNIRYIEVYEWDEKHNLNKATMKTAIEINQIQIHDYLKTRRIYPARRYCGYSMYHSSFREERTPSFK
ncbi:hypothetical protein AAKU52_003088 [Pedobacter sp. CG_S7]|uniref:hypothetical protein n=1 Tax=Pedobacter sp. CG_S7 TaxID=3143930 RepID=UPI00339452B9